MPINKCNHKFRHNCFQGHPNYQKASHRILSHPLSSEPIYFETRDFTTDQFFWPIETASVRASSISSIAKLLRTSWNNCPSGEAILHCLRNIPETEVETLCNRMLLTQYQKLPPAVRNELELSGMIIMDYHKDPYWGDPGQVAVSKGQKEHDSYYHFVYFTVDLLSEHFRFTIYVLPRVEGFASRSYLEPALQDIRQILTVRRVIFDGEFTTVDVLIFLEHEGIPWTARKSQTYNVRLALLGYKLDPMQFLHPRWHIVEIKGTRTQQSIFIHVTAYETNGIMKVITKPIWDNQSVDEARRVYKCRFSIDVGYKEKHAFQAVTSTQSWAVRLVLFLISVLLWNVWRLALAWNFIRDLGSQPEKVPLELSRNVITHVLGEYLVVHGWRLRG